MCLNVGLGLVGSALDFVSGTSRADAQNQYALMNARAANDAAIQSYGQEQNRFREQVANATRERIEAAVNARNAIGTALASSQNEGHSQDLSELDLARQGAVQMGLVDANLINRGEEHRNQNEVIMGTAQNRINSVSSVSGPGLLSLAVSGLSASSALSAGAKRRKSLMPSPGSKGLSLSSSQEKIPLYSSWSGEHLSNPGNIFYSPSLDGTSPATHPWMSLKLRRALGRK